MIHQYPSAFISSTFLDLKTERKTVTDLFKRLNIIPQALDTKPASNNSSKSEIKNGIRQSDFVVLLIGGRYGTIDKSFTESDVLSITHWEYNLAFNQKKPIIAMIKNAPSATDNNQEKLAMLERFKKILTHRHSPQYFDNSEELFEKVLHSIIPSYRNSIATHKSAISNLETENNALKSELQSLKEKLNPSQIMQPGTGLGLSSVAYKSNPRLGDYLGGSHEPSTSLGFGLMDFKPSK